MVEKEVCQGKSLEEKMALAEEIAKSYFRVGLNCSECVVRTFLDMYEIDLPEEVICMATGFGGGMGHTRNTCGAVTGAVMALGMIKGRKDPRGTREDMPERTRHLQKEIYPVFGEMVEEMKAHFGTLICAEMAQPFGDWEGKPRKRNCMATTAYCAALAVKYAETH